MPTHLFYQHNTTNSSRYLHLVILYRVQNYLWIGSIPQDIHNQLNLPLLSFGGLKEQIYDPFQVVQLDADEDSLVKFNVPGNIPHLLSQLLTSRHLKCPQKLDKVQFEKNNLTQLSNDDLKVQNAKRIFRSIKSMMKLLKMQFWLTSSELMSK